MGFLGRVIIYNKRNFKKSGTVLVLIFLLGTLLLGDISVRTTINRITDEIMRRIPAVSNLEFDVFAAMAELSKGFDVQNFVEQPTLEEITEMVNLPYVQTFDAIIEATIFGRHLQGVHITLERSNFPPESAWINSVISPSEEVRIIDTIANAWHQNEAGSFLLKGIQNKNILEIEGGLLRLSQGRTFTAEEIREGAMVAVIPTFVAEQNHLMIGDSVMLESIVLDTVQMAGEKEIRQPDEFLEHMGNERFYAHHEIFEFEIIGMFDVLVGIDDLGPQMFANEVWPKVQQIHRTNNSFYVPLSIVDTIIRNQVNAHSELEAERQSENARLFIPLHPEGAVSALENSLFPVVMVILESSRYLNDFRRAANKILPDFWEMNDFEKNFSHILVAVESLEALADLIFWLAAGGIAFILVLLSALNLHDRKQEIGLYVALGEKKVNIVGQFLAEMLFPAFIAITGAFFIENIVLQPFSEIMFERSIMGIVPRGESMAMFWTDTVALFFPAEIPMEELLAMHDASLSHTAVLTFASTLLLIISISLIIPIIRIMALNPKKVLQ